ncbi:hypothetical protein BGW80DRAFT_1308559 [Lactifluus volemus]|nr:hypothetical protein BGW80DRAFT_1308559 [Lactifluus volemus]
MMGKFHDTTAQPIEVRPHIHRHSGGERCHHQARREHDGEIRRHDSCYSYYART